VCRLCLTHAISGARNFLEGCADLKNSERCVAEGLRQFARVKFAAGSAQPTIRIFSMVPTERHSRCKERRWTQQKERCRGKLLVDLQVSVSCLVATGPGDVGGCVVCLDSRKASAAVAVLVRSIRIGRRRRGASAPPKECKTRWASRERPLAGPSARWFTCYQGQMRSASSYAQSRTWRGRHLFGTRAVKLIVSELFTVISALINVFTRALRPRVSATLAPPCPPRVWQCPACPGGDR
jgi:hypothetical protein